MEQLSFPITEDRGDGKGRREEEKLEWSMVWNS